MNTFGRDTTAIGLPDDSIAPEDQAAREDQVGRIEVHTIAIGRNPRAGYEQLFLEYGRFRGWIYTAVKDIMPSDQLGVDGVDFDRYDDYSAHLAAIEIVATDGVIEKKVVGASRLIIDIGDEAHPYVTAGLEPGLGLLPVEDHFPELASPVDLRDDRVRCEVSRYAALHRRPSMQRRITLALRRGITAHFINASGQQAYAVVERPLTDLLRRDGVTVEEITEPRHLPDYDSVNFGVWIDLHQLARDMGCDDTRTSPFNITEGVHDAVSR